jgi:hypothetical protein
MHITMTVIGSRGDVQPFVALGKGRKREEEPGACTPVRGAGSERGLRVSRKHPKAKCRANALGHLCNSLSVRPLHFGAVKDRFRY